MSGKSVAARPKNLDRRVRRTRNALGDALLELMQEKKFEDITVQQVLDRAGVGRSTFYKHYQDKDDLFLSDMEEFFEMFSTLLIRGKEASKRVAPVTEFFAHVNEMRHLYSALAAADKLQDFQDMAQEYFARAIRKRLEQLSSPPIPSAQSAATAQALAGALLSLMSWWLQSGATASPKEMDDFFHRMVWAGVSPSSLDLVQKKPSEIAIRTKRQIRRTPRNQRNGRKTPRG
jgi:AcrR family transcriptional regulator